MHHRLCETYSTYINSCSRRVRSHHNSNITPLSTWSLPLYNLPYPSTYVTLSIMKYLAFLALIFSSTTLGLVYLPSEQQQQVFDLHREFGVQSSSPSLDENSELRLIQLSPVETKWVTEEDKLEFKKVRPLLHHKHLNNIDDSMMLTLSTARHQVYGHHRRPRSWTQHLCLRQEATHISPTSTIHVYHSPYP